MKTLLLVVVTVVALAASPVLAKPNPYYADDSYPANWQIPPSLHRWEGPHRKHRIPFYQHHQPDYQLDYYPGNTYDSYEGVVDFGNNYDSSLLSGEVQNYDLNQRITEVKERCQDDLLLLRRLLQEQGHPLRSPNQHIPWFFPIFRGPTFPGQHDVVEKPSYPGVFPPQEEGDFGDFFDDTFDSYPDEKEYPKTGLEGHLHPFLPEVPDVDDLPDNYDNATHTIHDVNGSRVEVNTTTNKRTDGSVTTFFHTKVFNIIPGKNPKEEIPEAKETTTEGAPPTEKVEEVTEEPWHADGVTDEGIEVTTLEPTEEPPVEEVTEREQPTLTHVVPAEYVRADHEVSLK